MNNDILFFFGEHMDALPIYEELEERILAQILNGLLQTGFVMEAVEEAMPPMEWRDQMPEEMKRPMMLLVRAKKS